MYSILVIDDEIPILNAIEKVLHRLGFDVETAVDGYEGIKKFNENVFNVVLTDIRMPGLNGYDVLRHIRMSDRKYTPVIGMSGTPKILDCGFDEVIIKPFEIKMLKKQLNKFV